MVFFCIYLVFQFSLIQMAWSSGSRSFFLSQILVQVFPSCLLTAKFLIWEECGVMVVDFGHYLNWIESHLGISKAHIWVYL